jgi:3-hydroxybutyryl-CoA dehydratase
MDGIEAIQASEALSIEDLAVGMTADFAKTITEADVVAFSEISGDTNPIHLDEAYAATSRFGQRVAHGMLGASLISAVMGTKLPGPGAVYLSQTLQFKAPVLVGDTVTARVEVMKVHPGWSRAELQTRCYVGDKIVIDGHAVVVVPRRKQA